MADKRDEAASYDEGGATFDRLAEKYTGEYARFACEWVGVHAGDRALDAGTGTGLVARELGARVGGSGKVLGVDLSEGMLQVARARGRRLGLVPHVVQFRQGDVEGLELPDAGFDLTTSLFVLRHLPNPDQAVRELFRVTRPGGRVVVGVGDGAPILSPRGFRYRTGRLVANLRKRMGIRLEAPAYMSSLLDRYLPPGLDGTEGSHNFGRSARGTLRRFFEEAGFTEVEDVWRGHIDVIPDPQEFWDLQVHHCSPARYRIRGAPPEAVEALREEFLRGAHEVLDRGGTLQYATGTTFVKGKV